jgi:hypothetical protein
VTQNAPDINHLPFVFDGRNQSAFVVADIEDHMMSDYIRVSPRAPNICEIIPIRVLGDLVPCVQGRFPFTVPGGCFPNRPAADDPHEQSSHIEKCVSMGNPIQNIAPHQWPQEGLLAFASPFRGQAVVLAVLLIIDWDARLDFGSC